MSGFVGIVLALKAVLDWLRRQAYKPARKENLKVCVLLSLTNAVHLSQRTLTEVLKLILEQSLLLWLWFYRDYLGFESCFDLAAYAGLQAGQESKYV